MERPAADNVDRNDVRRRVYDYVASKEPIIVADAMIDATEVLVAVDIPVTGTRQVERAVCCERLAIKIGRAEEAASRRHRRFGQYEPGEPIDLQRQGSGTTVSLCWRVTPGNAAVHTP